MTRINLSEGVLNHSQRNNEIDPFTTCVPTSMVMMLKYSNINLPAEGFFTQVEDDLTNFVRTNPEVRDFYKNNPEKYIQLLYTKNYPANEIHAVMEFGVNKWLQKDIVKFTTKASLLFLARNLLKGKASALLGDFPYENKNKQKITLGHAVCLVGFETNQDNITYENLDVGQITKVIIDDPFGDYRTLYKETKGNDIEMPIDDFAKIIRDSNSITKWCYYIK